MNLITRTLVVFIMVNSSPSISFPEIPLSHSTSSHSRDCIRIQIRFFFLIVSIRKSNGLAEFNNSNLYLT